MSGKRYTDEFKIEEVRQITERGHKVAEVASRLGVTPHGLSSWVGKYGKAPAVHPVQRATTS